MLTTVIRALRWTDGKLQNLLADLAANYARELLAAHGLVEIEIDHIRTNYTVEPAVISIEAQKITRFVPQNENPVSQPSPGSYPRGKTRSRRSRLFPPPTHTQLRSVEWSRATGSTQRCWGCDCCSALLSSGNFQILTCSRN